MGVQTGLHLLLAPHATADQIRAGDVLLVHATCKPNAGGGPLSPCQGSLQAELTTTLASVFATVPALASYTDTLGTHEVSYPIAPGTTLPVAAPAAGTDVSLRLTFWRPQRRAVPDEVAAGAGQWIDMGGLIYYAAALGGRAPCPASVYSNVDPSLTASVQGGLTGPGNQPVLIDSARDQPADPHNTFSYTLDLSQCLAAAGASWSGRTQLSFGAVLPPVNGQPPNGADAAYYFHHPLPPVNTSPPTISGLAKQGQTLLKAHGGWGNDPTSYSSQWQDCDSSGNSCAAIAGASAPTYTLTASDVGHTIRVAESASNAAGTGGPVSSAQTAVVLA